MADHVYDIFGNAIEKCIIKYIKSSELSDLFTMKASEYSMLYFRLFYYYYTICRYTSEIEHDMNVDKLKQLFFEYYDKCATQSEKIYKEIIQHLRKTIDEKFEYLYNTFFVHNNVYFSTYFNNLIKYFLPLPFKLLNHAIVITYRDNVKQICRNDNIDYLEVINKTDFIRQRTFVKNKNIDAIKNELSYHMPIKYFSTKPFNTENDYVYLVACRTGYRKYHLVIAENLMYEKDSWNCTLMYTRNYNGIDEKLMREGMSFEILFKMWKKDTRESVLRNVMYICVLKKINTNDLFNVFPEINLSYKKLYHNTGLAMTENIANEKLEHPTFFYPNMSGYSEYFKNRKCIIYNVIKPMDRMIDTTRSIVTSNPFTNTDKTSINAPCSIDNNKDDLTLNQYIEQRPECDIQDQCHYTGRRKLQEILFKTRKYDASKIWIYEFKQEQAMKILGINEDQLYMNIYHHQLKNLIGIKISDYDAMILGDIGINGFFSTDYHRVWDKGGEVLLTNPAKFLTIDKFLDKMCFEVDGVMSDKRDQSRTNLTIKMNRPCDDPENIPDNIIQFPLFYSDDLNAHVNENIKHMMIGNKYRIIGSYNKKKLITDIDITNFLNTVNESLIKNNIQKLLKDLPKNITFVYMTLGTKYHIDELMTIDWDKSSQKDIVIKTLNKEKINQVETNLFQESKNKIMSMIQNDKFQGYMFLRDNTKIKWSQKDIINEEITCGNIKYNMKELLKSHRPILHFIMDYEDTFIIFDIAMKYGDIEQKYSGSGFLTYYNHEWFYILEDLSRSIHVSENTKQQIISLLNQYNGIKQIMMQLYYLEYIVTNNLISDSKFVKYFTYIIFGVITLKKSTKLLDENDEMTNEMKECINQVNSKMLKMIDPSVGQKVHAFNFGLFLKINENLKNHAIKFIELMQEKPKYYHLI